MSVLHWAGLIGASLLILSANVTSGIDSELSPEEAVRGYLTAFQKGDFQSAYIYVSRGMARNQEREDWVIEQKRLVEISRARILNFTIYLGRAEGDTAHVPNILKSKDAFFNQTGAVEYELYELIREQGQWRIDRQKLLVGAASVGEWFPREVVEGLD